MGEVQRQAFDSQTIRPRKSCWFFWSVIGCGTLIVLIGITVGVIR